MGPAVQLDLMLESGHAFWIATKHIRQHFDGDLAVEVRVLGTKVSAHGSGAKFFHDLIL